MKVVLKIIAYIIDVAFMPIRALIGLQIVICGSIMADVSVGEALEAYWDEIRVYPKKLMNATKEIF